jgi:hypothetical protein
MERWWSGREWSEYSRPLSVPEAAPAPAPARVPEPAFAGASASFSAPVAPTSPFGTSSSAATPAATGSMFEHYVATEPATQNSVSSSWYDPNFRMLFEPPPRNGKATAALVLSIVSFLFAPLSLVTFILAIVFSNLALKSARMRELAETKPVGRTRARWAVFFIVLTVLWTGVVGFGAYSYYQANFVYNHATIEAQFDAEMAKQGVTGMTLSCPEEGSFNPGSVISCALTGADGSNQIVDITINNASTGDISWALRQ